MVRRPKVPPIFAHRVRRRAGRIDQHQGRKRPDRTPCIDSLARLSDLPRIIKFARGEGGHCVRQVVDIHRIDSHPTDSRV